MKEFIDKLIERLEEEKQRLRKLRNNTVTLTDHEVCAIEEGAFNFCKKAVNELAEEYQNDNLSQLSNKYWKCLTKFGVDITEKWETATQNAVALEQAYMRGRQDEINRFTEEYESWVIIDGQYCWQTCGATEHCKECRRLGNCVIDYYENMGEYINCSTDASTKSTDCSTKVSEMPTGWIPCSINKHNEINVAEEMWVTMHNKESKYFFVRRLMWNGCLRRWEWDNGKPISDMWEVVAWKKIHVPAPYTEGE